MMSWEIIAFCTTLAGVWLTAKESILGWFWGIIGSLIYFFICYKSSLYSESLLQIFYAAMGVYGWKKWAGASHRDTIVKIREMHDSVFLFSFLIWILGTLILGTLLKFYSPADVPYSDASMAIAGLILTWQMAQKYIESWIGWVCINILNSFVFCYKSLYFTMVLFLLLACQAIIGYYRWEKKLKAIP